MGSKVNATVKVKRRTLNCEDCSVKFPNSTVLKRHRLKAHKKTRANKIAAPKGNKQTLPATKKVEKIKTVKKLTDVKKVTPKPDTEKNLPEQVDSRCHVCRKLFPTRSEMLDHYKAMHFRSSDNVKTKVDVTLNKLMNTVKKVTQDNSRCATCSKIFATRKSMLLHICQNVDESKEQYRCAGCKKKFGALEKMDAHIVTDHDDNIEILVFKDEDEFQSWKIKEEVASKINYITMSSTSKANKVYRCSASIKSDAKGNIKDLCPATIMLRSNKDFMKATFYKSHHGHPFVEIESKDFTGGTESSIVIENPKSSLSSNIGSSMDLEGKDTESDDAFESDLKLYKCLACDQTFNSMKQLNFHLNGAHNDDIYSILFPNNEEFEMWKSKMQSMTKTNYTSGVRYEQKVYYNCDASFKASTQIGENGLEWVIKKVCPSTIVTKQYDKGLQIHFYKKHYDHEHVHYVPTNEIRKYDIKNMFSQSTKRRNVYNPEYKTLKRMLLEVLSIAENLPVDSLRILINEANGVTVKAKTFLEKNQTLTSENKQDNVTTEKEITSNVVKRKLENEDIDKDETDEPRTSKRLKGRQSKKERSTKLIPAKNIIKKSANRTKSPSINTNIPITIAPKIVNTFTLATDFNEPIKDDGSINIMPHANGIETEENKMSEMKSLQEEPSQKGAANPRKSYEQLITTSTFNDSYKTFIESKSWDPKLLKNKSNKNNASEISKLESQQTVKKKNVRMKTKLGQYSPKTKNSKTPIKPSPMKHLSTSVRKSPSKSHIAQVPRKHLNTKVVDKSPNIKVLGKSRSSPIIGKPPSTPIIGKPPSTPIIGKPPSTPPILGKIKVERYEVKEQENDCNILILKI